MKRVIVSGAAGFIGNAVVRQLIEQNVNVVAVVKPGVMESEEAFRLKGLDIPIVECDIKNIEKLPELLAEKEYEVFYQLAWDGVDKDAFLDYERQIDNIRWMMKSIKVAADLKCKKFIGAGSITQLELLSLKGRLFTEDRHKYYRVAQSACENMGRAFAKQKGIQFIWPIIINVYGEGETAPRLVNNTIRNLLEKKHQAFSPAEQIYDFIHVQDAAKAFCLIGEFGKEESQYIIGSGKPRPLKEYLEIIRKVVAPNESLGLGELEFNGLEIAEENLNIDTLVNDTGFTPEISFEEGIRRTLKWIIRKE